MTFTLRKHAQEIDFFNALLIDLKKIQLGSKPIEPITMDRLEQGTKMLARLDDCRIQSRYSLLP